MTIPRTLDDYLDLAKDHAGLTSDRELARRLGKTANPCTQWRTRRSWPADGTMVKIAELAGVDPCQALLDLARWRTDGPARAAWTDLAGKAWRAGVLTGAAAFAYLVTSDAALAAVGQVGNSVTGACEHYMLWKIRIRRFLSRTLAHAVYLAREVFNRSNKLLAQTRWRLYCNSQLALPISPQNLGRSR